MRICRSRWVRLYSIISVLFRRQSACGSTRAARAAKEKGATKRITSISYWGQNKGGGAKQRDAMMRFDCTTFDRSMKSFYDENGYLVVERLLSADDLDPIR